MRQLLARARASDASGFTLVEMVMAVAILGILSTSIGVVGVVMFKTLGQTQSRLKETRGPRFASVHWVPDVASTEKVNPASGTTACGGSGLVTLQWTSDVTGLTTVTYATTTSGTERLLVRRQCNSGSSTPTLTTTIAPSIANPGATVTCGDGTTYAACTSADPDKSLLLTITPASGGGTFSIDAYREVT